MLIKDSFACRKAKRPDVMHLRLLRVDERFVLTPLPESIFRYLKLQRWCSRCAALAIKMAIFKAERSNPDFVWIMRGVGMRIEEAEFIWLLAEPYILGD